MSQVDSEQDPVLARALTSALRDEWRPAADAMASARDWERRLYIVLTLAAAAARRDVWLMKWLAAKPGDPDAAAVQAAATALQAS